MVFYSRYYIHEMLLVFFTAWTFICFWRCANSGRAIWAVAGGIGLGLMGATKETFVFALAAMALAVGTSALWGRARGEGGTGFPSRWKWLHVVAALAVAAVTAALFFTSFFTNAAGPMDALRAFLPWFRRAGGATEHVHPWTFYAQRLLFFHVRGGPFWSEGFVVALAAVGFFGALRGRSLLLRLIAFYTAWLTLIYTLLPYKTPWCVLGFYHGMILLAGVGAALLWRACHPTWLKAMAAVVLAAGVAHLGWQSWRGNFVSDASGVPYCDSAKSPYVYSQTLPDALRLVATVEGIANASPQGYGTVMEVMAPENSYGPLPWYFRRFEHVGYWDKIPAQPPAPIMIVSAELHASFDEGPGQTHLMAGYFALRPQVFLELYVNTNLWSAYIKTLPPEKD
jgi:predicted membrane-bound mannosyltransferase